MIYYFIFKKYAYEPDDVNTLFQIYSKSMYQHLYEQNKCDKHQQHVKGLFI